MTARSWHGFTPAKLPKVPSWVETLGRIGHVAKGAVYFIIGLLAFRLAIGAGGEISGAREAIQEIGEQPYGRFLLGITSLGLLSYTAWRWVEAFKDTEGHGKDAGGILRRTGYFISGLIYFTLGCFAGSLALGLASGNQNGGGGTESFLVGTTWGRVVLGCAGAIVVGLGIYFISRGWKAKFMSKYQLFEMSETLRRVALHAGRTGLITRGIALIIVGWFLFNSAWMGTSDGEISGMQDALAAIAAQPYGKYLLGITGFGLMAYAVHTILLGVYRRFNVERS